MIPGEAPWEDWLEDVLLVTREERVAILTLNRPESLNALDAGLMKRLAQGVREVADDDSVRCVVLTGAGKGFCSGGDVQAISKARAADVDEAVKKPKPTLESRVRWLRRSVEAARLLHEMPKPAIAMVNGACAGAGMSLIAACDFRFAGASSKFVPAFVAGGMSGDYGGNWFWTRILGTAKARQLCLLGEKRDAQAALEFGLVDKVFPDEDLRAETLAVAHRLANLPAAGVAYAKANLNAALTEPLPQFLDRESLNMMLARQAILEARKAAVA
jgi:2-(1,2-epoxy-1,2-dihydrophenyl)acetyl-CoA isomerase